MIGACVPLTIWLYSTYSALFWSVKPLSHLMSCSDQLDAHDCDLRTGIWSNFWNIYVFVHGHGGFFPIPRADYRCELPIVFWAVVLS